MLLRRTDVNGNVKSNFKAHWDLLQNVGKFLIIEQAMEYFGMESHNSLPTKNKPPADISNADNETKTQEANRLLRMFLNHYEYGEFSLEATKEKPMQNQVPSTEVKYVVIGSLKTAQGNKLVVKKIQEPESLPVKPQPDRLYNYSSNLCHWALHLMQLDDTAKEGDTDRLIINCKYNLAFFFTLEAVEVFY